MFDHVTIRVSDREASERFYLSVLRALDVEQTWSDEESARWDDFSLAVRAVDKPVTRHLHIGFAAASRELVDAFWRIGTGAGYRDDGPPGERPFPHPGSYGASVLDPDGNDVELVHHNR